MRSVDTISHTVIVSETEALGYVQAASEVGGVKVVVRVPETTDEAELLVAEHVGTLLLEHQPPADEVNQFIAAATADLEGAFGDLDGSAALVRVTTERDDRALTRLDDVAVLAGTYRLLPE